MPDDDTNPEGELLRSEEELRVGTRMRERTVLARKQVETNAVEQPFERRVESYEAVERVDVGETDSGEIETLPDGSISIPILEEELVVTKRLVVRERIVLRKRVTTETEVVRAELRRERLTLEQEDAS
jgi:uncharacterized protein (TIGR02271 family)